jgi:DHA1 family tetracycline resistance protein-like MFS transporter
MTNSKHHINKNLFTLLLTLFLDFLGFGIVIPVIAPAMFDPVNGVLHGGYSMAERTVMLGFLISAFPVAQFFGAPILGAFSDKYGRKKILLISILSTAVSLFLFGVGITLQNLPILFFSRILNGFMGGNVSTAQSAIADMSDLQSKSKNFGMMGMMFGLGFILGPFVGGKLSDFHTVQWFTFATPFWVAGILSIINVWLVAVWFKETLQHPKNNAEISFTTGIKNLARAFTSTDLRTIFIVSFLAIFGFTSFTQFFQVYLISKFQFNQAHIGSTYAYLGLWIAIAQGGIIRVLAKKYSPEIIIRFSTVVLSVAVFLLLVPGKEMYLFFILPFVAMAQGATTPNITTIISNSARADEQGEILGVNQSVQALAFAIPPMVAGFVSALDVRLPIIIGSIFIFASWLVFIISFRKVSL